MLFVPAIQVWERRLNQLLADCPDGAILKIKRFPFDHQAILWRDVYGRLWAFHNDRPNGVTYMPLVLIVMNDDVEVIAEPESDGHAAIIRERALALMNTAYDWLNWNCESFVSYCYTGVAESDSVRRGVLWGFLGGGFAAIFLA
jgi:hypothetical protein